jgi:hypothetical protein
MSLEKERIRENTKCLRMYLQNFTTTRWEFHQSCHFKYRTSFESIGSHYHGLCLLTIRDAIESHLQALWMKRRSTSSIMGKVWL